MRPPLKSTMPTGGTLATVTAMSKMEKEADLVMGTNNSSIVSKRSVELRYDPQHQFFRPFVKKPQRRAPIINRGYWLRMHAIAETVRQFLQDSDPRPKYILNLGCGYDPLAFQLLKSEKTICTHVTFVDIDYEKLMGIKTSIIQQTEELRTTLGDIQVYPESEAVRLRASNYVALGCDLKNLTKLEEALKDVLGPSPATVLCIAEVSLTYMDVRSADALISWLPTLGKDMQFCVLEQFFPDGPHHPFASTMMKHFHKLRAPLHSIHKYPTLSLQEQRFLSQGWHRASARSLWDIWNDDSFVSQAQRLRLDTVEYFDEWEEFALFASHYFILIACTAEAQSALSPNQPRTGSPPAVAPLRVTAHRPVSFTGQRRFAASIAEGGDVVGVHGGLGNQSRLSSMDLYFTGTEVSNSICAPPSHSISARMCHTVTSLQGDARLLVGGRASPNAALSDCWVRRNNTWEPTDSLPLPRFRHCSVPVQIHADTAGVLVYGGKTSSGDILNSWTLWEEQKGWQTVEVAEPSHLTDRFGAQMVAVDAASGYLFGGISRDGLVLEDFWKWALGKTEDNRIIVRLTNISKKLHDATHISDYIAGRFGATTNVVSGRILIIGGIGVRGVLPEQMELLCLDLTELSRDQWTSAVVQTVDTHFESPALRPLLTGHVSETVDSSVIIATGGAVCFSFGTFWNNYIWQICDTAIATPHEWKFHSAKESKPSFAAKVETENSNSQSSNSCGPTSIQRMTIQNETDFKSIMKMARPVVIVGLDIGSCTEKWSNEYLVKAVGSDRQIVVHEAQSNHMNFRKKNFDYTTKEFGVFMDEISEGSRQYLRSISSEQPLKKAANFEKDFPEIQNDFTLPPQLSFVQEHAHSSPLRISGPVAMWLHYDVMANVYCQIRGNKKLVLYPPSDVEYLEFQPGASSSTLDIFDDNIEASRGQIVPVPHTTPHEATLGPGEILYIPPLWLHAAWPVGGISVAINIFFRNLDNGYAAGRDVYANRDLEAYEKGRVEVEKIGRYFEGLPPDVASFYLVRLANELKEKARNR